MKNNIMKIKPSIQICFSHIYTVIGDMRKEEQYVPSNRIEIGDRLGRRFLLDEFSVKTSEAGDDRCQNDKANSEAQPNLPTNSSRCT